MKLNMDGREKTKVEVNGSLRGQGLKMQMGKKIWHRKRYLRWLDKDMGHKNSNIIEVRALVVGLRYIVHRRHKLLGMLARIFLVFMQ